MELCSHHFHCTRSLGVLNNPKNHGSVPRFSGVKIHRRGGLENTLIVAFFTTGASTIRASGHDEQFASTTAHGKVLVGAQEPRPFGAFKRLFVVLF